MVNLSRCAHGLPEAVDHGAPAYSDKPVAASLERRRVVEPWERLQRRKGSM